MYGGSDGSLTLELDWQYYYTFPVPPFEFSIDSGLTYQTSSSANITFNNLSAGRYYISVRDSNGCESDIGLDWLDIIEPDSLIYNFAVISDVACDGSSNGSAYVCCFWKYFTI